MNRYKNNVGRLYRLLNMTNYTNTLYQTFYPYNKFDSVDALAEFMFSKAFVEKMGQVDVVDSILPKSSAEEVIFSKSSPVKTFVENGGVAKSSVDHERKKPAMFVPEKPDSLFWCMYIHHHGHEQYLAIGNKYSNIEMAEKQLIMEYIQKNKHIFKNMNRKITLGCRQEIMSELMTNSKTSLLALHALSLYYRVNVRVENAMNGTYLEYIFSADTPSDKWVCLKYNDRKKYGIVDEISSGLLCIDSHDKPIRGISTYKVAELEELVSKIPTLKDDPARASWKKPDMYGKLWHALLWQ